MLTLTLFKIECFLCFWFFFNKLENYLSIPSFLGKPLRTNHKRCRWQDSPWDMPKNLNPFPSLTYTAHFGFAASATERRGFSTSLDRLTSVLQINSDVRRGFQPFAITNESDDKQIQKNVLKYFLTYYICPCIFLPITAVLSTSSFFFRGPKECRAGLGRSRKAVFPGYILTFSQKFTGWPKTNHTPFPYQSPVPEQWEPLSSVKHSQTYWQ